MVAAAGIAVDPAKRLNSAVFAPHCASKRSWKFKKTDKINRLSSMPINCDRLQMVNQTIPRSPAMRRMQEFARNPAMIALFTALVLTGCASKKNNLPNNAADLGLAGNAAPGTQQDFTVNVGDRIFFDTDSSVVRADAAATLDRQAQWLNQYPNYQITIEGHADERGTREYNLALGARRAAATRQYLSTRGVAANRIQTISFGKERPVAVCDDISCWSQNRRAVTALRGAGS
jgi:peptidoglycan-associated lipoprotein|tara:strand:- start:251 stop:946 length:696 start_codon:yes stop_codon:yes gene_type:complete